MTTPSDKQTDNQPALQPPERIWIRPTDYGSIWSPTKLHHDDAEYVRVRDGVVATVGHEFLPPAGAMCIRCGLSVLAHATTAPIAAPVED